MVEGESSTAASTVAIIYNLAKFMSKGLAGYKLQNQSCVVKEEKSRLIYKVPQHLRVVEEHSYKPAIVSIGPYHHKTPSLQAMEKEKWFCLDIILRSNPQKPIRDYLTAISKLENRARNCYSENIDVNSGELWQMLLLDGCFILVQIGLLAGIRPRTTEENGISIDSSSSSVATTNHVGTYLMQPEVDQRFLQNFCKFGKAYAGLLFHDLLLMENQIPIFIIQSIYEILTENMNMETPFTEKVTSYIERSLEVYPKAIRQPNRTQDLHHLLHLCHTYFKPTHRTSKGNGSNPIIPGERRWCQAVQYHKAGIQFKKRKFHENSPHSLLDIKFSKGTLEIPFLPIDENTTSLFRNLLAFEQTCPQLGTDFTTYVAFISQLISTPEDVTLLVRKGIIEHSLERDDEVSTLFTKLDNGLVIDFKDYFYLQPVYCAMKAWYERRWNHWMAWLKQNHFRNPCLAFAALAAVIILLCTIAQVVFSVLSRVKLKK